jgi:hypothetical protein
MFWVNNPIVDFERHNKNLFAAFATSPPAAALIVVATLLFSRSDDIYSQLAVVHLVSSDKIMVRRASACRLISMIANPLGRSVFCSLMRARDEIVHGSARNGRKSSSGWNMPGFRYTSYLPSAKLLDIPPAYFKKMPSIP